MSFAGVVGAVSEVAAGSVLLGSMRMLTCHVCGKRVSKKNYAAHVRAHNRRRRR